MMDKRREICAKTFVSEINYWRYLVIGTITILGMMLGMAGGVYAWGLSVTEVDARQSERISNNKEHIISLEQTVSRKLDHIIKAVEKK
ncbi:MAG: hypothetical protein GF414_01505 [Candidatus Altiarchaeales archaeon]|nr:hypothetical protein [Candidatus Altiarchaeales archaeon]